MNLTPKQIQALRIAVAEVAGWTLVNPKTVAEDAGTPYWWSAAKRFWPWLPDSVEVLWALPPNERIFVSPIPNYPEDLNEVHIIQMRLTDDQWDAYWQDLNQVVEAVKINETYACWQSYKRIYGATALQRSIALLMTLAPDKWLEIQNLKD